MTAYAARRERDCATLLRSKPKSKKASPTIHAFIAEATKTYRAECVSQISLMTYKARDVSSMPGHYRAAGRHAVIITATNTILDRPKSKCLPA